MEIHWAALFANEHTIFYKVVLPPILYFAHGYLATWMAVAMLFHPYDAYFVPGTKIQIPLTPGIFPKRRAKLAQAVASTVTETLLTPKDIKDQVERLQEHGLDCANWDAVVYNRGVRDALRVLLNYERLLDVVSEDEPDADPV